MIFMNIKKKNNPKLHELNEDIIRMVTKLNFLDDKTVTSFELNDYIDNTIIYFESRIYLLEKAYRNNINSFIKMKKSILKELAKADSLNINITMRKPNDMFYILPDPTLLKDFTNVTFDQVYQNSKIGKDISSIYDMSYAGYNVMIKNATNGKVLRPKNIGNLYDIMSSDINIKNKEHLKKYLDELIFHDNDVDVIRTYISFVIRELQMIKSNYFKTKGDVNNVKYSNCIAALTMYRKNNINVLLNIYSIKLSIMNLKPELNESYDDISFCNTDMFNESIYLSEGNIEEAIKSMEQTPNTYLKHLVRLESYVKGLYERSKRRITYYTHNTVSPFGYEDSMHLKKALTNIESTIDKEHPEYYISSVESNDDYECSNFMEFIPSQEQIDIKISEFKEKEKEILKYLEDDYNTILDRINYLKTNYSRKNVVVSSIYERPFNKLGVYAADLKESLIRDLVPIENTSKPIHDYINLFDNTTENLAIVLNQIDTKFDNDSATHWKKKITSLSNFLKTNFWSVEDTNGDANMCSEWYENDDLLMAYILFFKIKAHNL